MVTHFVAYGSYRAPCGWTLAKRGKPLKSDLTTTTWYDPDGVEEVTCPGCVAHARREFIYSAPDLPESLDPAELERWLAS